MRYNRDNDEETIVFHNIFIFLFLRIFITKIMHTILETIFQYNQTTFSLFFHIIARYKVLFPLSNLVNFASESINSLIRRIRTLETNAKSERNRRVADRF